MRFEFLFASQWLIHFSLFAIHLHAVHAGAVRSSAGHAELHGLRRRHVSERQRRIFMCALSRGPDHYNSETDCMLCLSCGIVCSKQWQHCLRAVRGRHICASDRQQLMPRVSFGHFHGRTRRERVRQMCARNVHIQHKQHGVHAMSDRLASVAKRSNRMRCLFPGHCASPTLSTASQLDSHTSAGSQQLCLFYFGPSSASTQFSSRLKCRLRRVTSAIDRRQTAAAPLTCRRIQSSHSSR